MSRRVVMHGQPSGNRTRDQEDSAPKPVDEGSAEEAVFALIAGSWKISVLKWTAGTRQCLLVALPSDDATLGGEVRHLARAYDQHSPSLIGSQARPTRAANHCLWLHPVQVAALTLVPSQVKDGADYAPLRELADLTDELLRRFPQAQAQAQAAAIQRTASFDHLFAGVVMLADWLGPSLQVRGADWRPQEVRDLIATLPWSGWHSGQAPASILRWPPLGAQAVIGAVLLASRLVVVEAPTGTGKTETALLHALRLVEAGEVDGLYFSLPTRAAATEIHERIARMARAHSPALAGRVVRAVTGLLDTDPWQRDQSSWAIASPKRVMDESFPTRLGDPRVTITLTRPLVSPLTGAAITALPVPGRWLKGVKPGTQGDVSPDSPGHWRVMVGQVQLNYGRYGLEWVTA